MLLLKYVSIFFFALSLGLLISKGVPAHQIEMWASAATFAGILTLFLSVLREDVL